MIEKRLLSSVTALLLSASLWFGLNRSAQADSFTVISPMSTLRSDHTATLLSNGKLLVAGGAFISTAELFDPGTGTWKPTGSMTTNRGLHTATLLSNGKVL